jgi:hypothetical protein
MSKSMELLILS